MCKKLLIFVLMFGFASSAMAIHDQATGEILFEYWMDIGGVNVGDLTSQADFPDNPGDGELRPSFDGKLDWADNYGTRVSGWLYPPEDGDYTFWVAGDDGCDLLLSTDGDAANAVVIAQVPDNGWTSYQQWDSYPEQQSAPVTLAAGVAYYIGGLHKEGGGGDSFSAGWQGPGIGDPNTITVIDGAYLAPADWALGLLQAGNPDPADGAVDVVDAILTWTPGKTAVSHAVYLNDELLIETELGTELAAAPVTPGTAYTWRVDEVQEDGSVIEGKTWSFTTLPLEAHFPDPADGAEDVKSPVTLSWTKGKDAILSDVYFGDDEALVAARDQTTFKGRIMDTSYPAGDVELFSTYYWAVDSFTPGGIVPGPLWSFSTEQSVSILDGDATLDYDNRAYPYVSELAIDTVADLTAGGLVSDVVLSLVGNGPPPPDEGGVAVDDVNGIYEVTGSGNDIWANSDQFHYVYMNLTGDGEISARVVSNGTGSNNWAKGGVMIRETNDADSKHMIMGLTGSEGGGICFQGRVETAGGSTSYHGDVTAEPPHWVKLTREGNAITAYHSADGIDWALFEDSSPDGGHSNPIDLVMQDKVLVGLFVTSHASGETRTYTIDNVDIQGDVDMVIVNQDIGIGVGNTPAPIYAALEDSTGAVATVPYPFPGATMIELERDWIIPLSDFEGVDPTAAAKFIVGVGDGEAGGTGSITVSDIKVSESVTPAGIESWLAAAEAAGAGFLASNVSMGIYDIGANSGDITYEFIVNSNPDEQEGSMALIGRNIGDETKAAIKYEQWNNTETYGATVFGVADHDYGVAISRGVDTHLAFVSSEDLGTTELYVDGEPMGSVPAAITLAGNVGIGLANRDTTGLDPQDPFDGTIWGAAIYDSALTAEQIAANADAFAGSGGSIVWVSFHGGDDEPHADAVDAGFTMAPDIEYTDLLKAQGYDVTRYITTGDPDVDLLNAADLVITSRSVNSGDYSNDSATIWNGVTSPMIILGGYPLRTSRMGFTTGTTMVDTVGDITLAVTDPEHPIFAGIALTDGVMDNLYASVVTYPTDGTTLARGLSINNNPANADGTVLATVATVDDPTVGGMVIGEWSAGATMEHNGGAGTDILAGDRLVFLTGSRETSGISSRTAGLYDLYDDGAQMLLNAVEYMLP